MKKGNGGLTAVFAIRIGYFAVKYYGQHSCKKVHRQTDTHTHRH